MNPINLIARKYNIPQDLEIYVIQECILPSKETTRNNMKMVRQQIERINNRLTVSSFPDFFFYMVEFISSSMRYQFKWHELGSFKK